MSIDAAITDAIKKNLPEEVGTTLKKVLEQAEKDAKTVVEQKYSLQEKEDRIGKLLALKQDAANVEAMRAELLEKERQLEVREAVLAVSEQWAAKSYTEMRETLGILFKGIDPQTMAVSLFGNTSLQTPMGNYNGHVDASGSIQKE